MKNQEKENNMSNHERQEQIIKICNEVTQDILRNRKRLTDQCSYGAEELRKRAKRIGIQLKIQGGLWKKATEHNWCIDPIDGSIYDPTAEQFKSGINGLQTALTIPFYIPVTVEEAEEMIALARSQGWTSRHTEGISQIAVGYEIYKENHKLLEEFKKFYPELKHKVVDDRGDELKIAKNDCFYAIIRLGGVSFNITHSNVTKGKNKVLMTKPKVRSFVVFKNKNNSYSIQEINQRLFVSPSGKHGIITKRGEKIQGLKLSKANTLYTTKATDEDGEVTFKTSKVKDNFYLQMILQLEQMIADHNKEGK
jgi:hypothetical protein